MSTCQLRLVQYDEKRRDEYEVPNKPETDINSKKSAKKVRQNTECE
jgi:hypothetical protein